MIRPGIIGAMLVMVALSPLMGCATWEREVTTRAQAAATKKAATEERLYCNTQSTGWYLRLPQPRQAAFTDYCNYLGYGGEGPAPATPGDDSGAQ